jgi:hypothetical protein
LGSKGLLNAGNLCRETGVRTLKKVIEPGESFNRRIRMGGPVANQHGDALAGRRLDVLVTE